MKRFLAFVLSSTLVLSVGCGYRSYELRLQTTENRIKDELTLDTLLNDPPRGEFEQVAVHVRPPKPLQQTQVFAPPVDIPPGYFDVASSFVDLAPAGEQEGGGLSLHVLARLKRDPDAQQEQGEPAPALAQRGSFVEDVRQVLAVAYGSEATSASTETISKTVWPRSDPPRSNSFDRMSFQTADGRLIQVYLAHEESGQDEYEAALIFEVAGGQASTAASNAMDMTLGTFAIGPRAIRHFRGEGDADGIGGAPDDGPLTPF